MAQRDEAVRTIADGYRAAWNTGEASAVAAFYAPTGQIVINGGDPWEGRSGVAEMAAGFFADVPDLHLTCDGVRRAGGHVAYLWTFTAGRARAQRSSPPRGNRLVLQRGQRHGR